MQYITERDVADRILRRISIWPNGKPSVAIEGEEGQFGYIILDFHDDDGIEKFGIRLVNKQKIKEITESAIQNFKSHVREIYDEG